MKKLSLTIVLCLTVAFAFGQKKALGDVKREIGHSNPNFENARSLINDAKDNPETKDDAETWYVAGLVEFKEFELGKNLKLIQKTPDEAKMYAGLKNIIPNFIVADSLDMLPNEKGKVKPRYRKGMKSVLLDNRLDYIDAGIYYFNDKNYEDAYNLFQQFFDIPKLKMFEGDNIAAKDTAYALYRYYAGLSLAQFGTTNQIASYFEGMKDNNGYNENEIFQTLCSLYERNNDTVNLIKTLKEGVAKFPKEPYFLLNLINQYIFSNQGDVAVELITKAIATMPERTAELYTVLGIVYENSQNEIGVAKVNFEKALSVDPDYVDALSGLGRINFNKALEAQRAANEITDNKKFNEAKAKYIEMFREALPYFEKAHQLRPDDRDVMIALSHIYYTLNMNSKFDQIEKELGH